MNARFLTHTLLASTLLSGWTSSSKAQELEPRAYATLPVGINFFLVGFSRSTGSVLFDPSLPIEDVTAGVNVSVLGYVRGFDFFGRSASVGVVLPYVWADMEGLVEGEQQAITRSGLADVKVRFSFNLVGGPALDRKEFAKYQQKRNLGVTVVLVAPTGQYDPVKLINIGANRWALKTELGFSRAYQKWHFDLYGGVWFYADNKRAQGTSVASQRPIGTFQAHVSYSFRRRLWAAFDATAYVGGSRTLDGRDSAGLQKASRFGFTFSIPVARQHSFKFNASTGAFTRIGADFNLFAVAYQYFWY